MKSRESLLRLKRFEVDERRQKVASVELMIADFKAMAADLDRQIQFEQDRAGVSDVNHYAYPTFAKAAIQRRDNLLVSAQELAGKLADARDRLAEAVEELKKVELLDEREKEQARAEAQRAEQAAMDEIGGMRHRAAS
jgi:flagellar FliJ protein